MVEFKTKELGKREMRATVSNGEVITGKKFKLRQLHLEFEPIGVEWKEQHEWYMLTDDIESAFGVLTSKLIELKLITTVQVNEAKDLEVLANLIVEAISGKEIYWKELETPKKESTVWLPVSIKSE